MLRAIKKYLSGRINRARFLARSECLQIVDDAIEECYAPECWNFTAKRIRDKIAALDNDKKGNS